MDTMDREDAHLKANGDWVESDIMKFALERQRGPLCIRHWSTKAQRVLCRSTVTRTKQPPLYSSPPQTTGDISGFWIGDELCTGDEQNIGSCLNVRYILGFVEERCPFHIVHWPWSCSRESGINPSVALTCS